MKTRLALLFASTALTMVLGLPALAAMQAQGNASGICTGVCAAVFGSGNPPGPVVRVSDNDDDDGGWVRRGHGRDDDDDCDEDDGDDHHDDDDHGDDHDDDGNCAVTGARGNPAPAGTVAPPANGLFGNGAPPVVVTN